MHGEIRIAYETLVENFEVFFRRAVERTGLRPEFFGLGMASGCDFFVSR